VSVKIPPTVGRVVHYYIYDAVSGTYTGPLSAQIAFVWSATLVNLGYLDPNGKPCSATSVPLIQDGEERPKGHYCCWMPYQVGQAQKTEQAEAVAAAAKKGFHS